ncbi:MAG: hypothetical protein LBC73_05135 [Oscillospiraceae bacterium]|jgi:hypothetical protein|nr:hypothetical protein [Oscillospiraceae bacterium]
MLIRRRANRIVHSAMSRLSSIHRSRVGHSGLASEDFATEHGDFKVASEAVKKARRAAYWRCWLFVIPRGFIEDAAYRAAVNVLINARAKGLIYLRDGSRSATAQRAYLLSSNLV